MLVKQKLLKIKENWEEAYSVLKTSDVSENFSLNYQIKPNKCPVLL